MRLNDGTRPYVERLATISLRELESVEAGQTYPTTPLTFFESVFNPARRSTARGTGVRGAA